MNDLNYLNKVRKNLNKIKTHPVVIYGSLLSEYYIPDRSDIDIAIITYTQKKEKNIAIWMRFLGEFDSPYDIKIFELLPLYLKIEIIENYQVVFGDPLEISEYFYYYRSIWKDMTYRINSNRFKNISEKINSIENRVYLF